MPLALLACDGASLACGRGGLRALLRRLLMAVAVTLVAWPAFLGATAGPPDFDEFWRGSSFRRAAAFVAATASASGATELPPLRRLPPVLSSRQRWRSLMVLRKRPAPRNASAAGVSSGAAASGCASALAGAASSAALLPGRAAGAEQDFGSKDADGTRSRATGGRAISVSTAVSCTASWVVSRTVSWTVS